MSWETCSIFLCLCIWTTFSFFHLLPRYTCSTSAEFYDVCLRTACLSRQRSACFMPSLSRFSVRWFRRRGSAWTLTRFVLSLIGLFLIRESRFSGFWGLPIFTVVLSGILVVSLLRLLLSPLLRLAFLGPGLLRMRSSGLRVCLPPLPSSSLLIPRDSL